MTTNNTPATDEGKSRKSPLRLQFEIADWQLSELDEFVENAGFGSRKDLMIHMIAMWRWAQKEIEQGKEIASVDLSKNLCRPLTMPAFEHMKQVFSKQGLRYDETQSLDIS
jgi:hypothetical protein